MSLQIRTATNADCEAVVRVISAVFDEYSFTWDEGDYHADLYDLEGYYAAQGDSFFVAEQDGVVVGTVGLARYPLLEGVTGQLEEREGFIRVLGTDCSLERLYVDPNARRSGIGFQLVRHVVDLAKSEARTGMELWSDKKFVDAHRLYGKFGAKVVGDRICHDPDQSPEWGLIIELAAHT